MPEFEPGPCWWEASAVNIYMLLGKLPKSYSQTGQQKRATCFATLLQNELKSYVLCLNPGGRGGGTRRKISKAPLKGTSILFYGHVPDSFQPLKGTSILFYGHVPDSFQPLKGTNSATTNYAAGTANFNSNKDNF